MVLQVAMETWKQQKNMEYLYQDLPITPLESLKSTYGSKKIVFFKKSIYKKFSMYDMLPKVYALNVSEERLFRIILFFFFFKFMKCYFEERHQNSFREKSWVQNR